MPASLLLALLLTAPQAAPAPAQTPPTPSSAPAMEYADAKLRSDADEATVTGAAHADMVKRQSDLLDAGIAACARDELRDDFTPFTIVMQLDASGQVQQTWRQGSSPLAICMQRYVRDKTVFTPPKAPFFNSIEVSFTK
ncbi:MAG: hypothetical protein K8F33_04345 [Thermomonas sp.]|uniref:hypothetical protein n=1 Tax=Thermomonas sp. TaxID=1971895 RepID=UPI001D3216C5|nr:hypothetical protein [Thermomonas sp.]MBZ0087306.1 hypothetical protein [Thermomonas sp.]MCO5054054.1 hypothetical protein [Thermomonas sp.]